MKASRESQDILKGMKPGDKIKVGGYIFRKNRVQEYAIENATCSSATTMRSGDVLRLMQGMKPLRR